MMNFKMKGFDELSSRLQKLANNPSKIKTNPTYDELFSDKFMLNNTAFNSFEEFAKNSGFDFNDIDSIPEDELDIFVSNNSQYKSWKEMLLSASQEYVQDTLLS